MSGILWLLFLLVIPGAAIGQETAVPKPDGGFYRLELAPEDRARLDELIVELRILNTRIMSKGSVALEDLAPRPRRSGRRSRRGRQ